MLFIKRTYRYWLLILFVAMIILGIYQGEMTVVLEKAVRICLECIGIG